MNNIGPSEKLIDAQLLFRNRFYYNLKSILDLCISALCKEFVKAIIMKINHMVIISISVLAIVFLIHLTSNCSSAAEVKGQIDSKQSKKIKTEIDSKIKEKFDPLALSWESHNCSVRASSNSKDRTDCPEYRAIVLLGEPAIPCIMERYLKQNIPDNEWYQFALTDIIGIKRNSTSFNFDQEKKFWTDWWDWQQGKLATCPSFVF